MASEAAAGKSVLGSEERVESERREDELSTMRVRLDEAGNEIDGVPELVDEGAVTRALTVEDVITHEYVTAVEDVEVIEVIEEVVAAPRPIEVEPSLAVALDDEQIARLMPAVEQEEPDERTTAKFEREPVTISSPPQSQRPSPASVVGLLRPNGAVILLGLLCALALVESIAAFLAYRERVEVDDWQALEQLLAEHEGEPVIVASEWLGPSARMHMTRTRSWDSVAFPDLRGFERFWLLTHAEERPWRGPLRAELEELPRPELLAIHRVGELALHEYQQQVGTPTFSLLDSIGEVSTSRGRCSGESGSFRCKEGRVGVRLLEVDYRVRRCLALELEDGVMATVELGEVELGDRIYGHVGFGDFNARLRADPSARLELRINDVIAGRWVFTDDQGWAAFALVTAPGRHELELRVGTTVGGTWQHDGHQSSPTDTLCVELRGFDESGLPTQEEGA
jgi:hypothetical protein